MPPRTLHATRYVTPLREGGSMPAIVEADDLGLYVLKFRGAGQGPLALAAEWIAGEIGRALGLPVPDLAFLQVDPALGLNEPDAEIQALLRASEGLNLGMDYLPGSITFDAATRDTVDPDLASRIVWFDAFVTNVDRTARNTNLLLWHKKLFLIDHGASLYFHHNWSNLDKAALSPFAPIRDHVLLRFASRMQEADETLRSILSEVHLQEILAGVPDAWLLPEPEAPTPDLKRAAYVRYLMSRLAASNLFVQEVLRARG